MKPFPPPPVEVPTPQIAEEEEELYDEALGGPPPADGPQAEDYLSFEPTHAGNIDEGVEPQEVYEAMEVMVDEQDLYVEPGELQCAWGREV
jgi:hypothetical protein